MKVTITPSLLLMHTGNSLTDHPMELGCMVPREKPLSPLLSLGSLSGSCREVVLSVLSLFLPLLPSCGEGWGSWSRAQSSASFCSPELVRVLLGTEPAPSAQAEPNEEAFLLFTP